MNSMIEEREPSQRKAGCTSKQAKPACTHHSWGFTTAVPLAQKDKTKNFGLAISIPNEAVLVYLAGYGGTHLHSQLLRRLRQEDLKFETNLDNIVQLISK
jgi:hypothetical protein